MHTETDLGFDVVELTGQLQFHRQPGAAHHLDHLRQPGCAVLRQLFGGMFGTQQFHGAAKLAQGLATGGGDGGQCLLGDRRITAQRVFRAVCLHDDHTDRVGHHIVQFARNPGAFGRDRIVGAAFTVVVGDRQTGCNLRVIRVAGAEEFGQCPTQRVVHDEKAEQDRRRLIHHGESEGAVDHQPDQVQQALAPADVGDQGIEGDADREQRRRLQILVENHTDGGGRDRQDQQRHRTGTGIDASPDHRNRHEQPEYQVDEPMVLATDGKQIHQHQCGRVDGIGHQRLAAKPQTESAHSFRLGGPGAGPCAQHGTSAAVM